MPPTEHEGRAKVGSRLGIHGGHAPFVEQQDIGTGQLQELLAKRAVAAALNISKGVVAKYASLAAAAGLDWPTAERLSEAALERRLVGGRADRPSHYAQPDFGRIHQELRRKGMTLMLLWCCVLLH